MSGTANGTGAANATDAAARRVKLSTRCNHPRVGLNLLMAGDNLLGGGTGAPEVTVRYHDGQKQDQSVKQHRSEHVPLLSN